MFSLIRGVIIVGLIFYFSPERDRGEPDQKPRGGEPPAAALPPPVTENGHAQDDLWNRLVGSFAREAVRSTVTGKAQESGLRLKEAALLPAASPKVASAEADQSSPGQSVRCIYRCDGTE
jgi:hypothetical protein